MSRADYEIKEVRGTIFSITQALCPGGPSSKTYGAPVPWSSDARANPLN